MRTYFPLLKYLGAFLLIYFLLLGIFSMPSMAGRMAQLYSKVSEPIFQTIFPKAYLRLGGDTASDPNPNIIRVVYSSQEEVNRQIELAKQSGSKQLNMAGTSYDLYFNLLFTTFFIFLLALIFITPISIKSKLWAIVAGFLIFYLFTVFKISIFLLDLFNQSTLQMYQLGDFGTWVVGKLALVFKSLGFSSFIVILIWGLVAFRKSNWEKVLNFSRGKPAILKR